MAFSLWATRCNRDEARDVAAWEDKASSQCGWTQKLVLVTDERSWLQIEVQSRGKKIEVQQSHKVIKLKHSGSMTEQLKQWNDS